ncbi:hypothetical protein PRIPAC_89069 [Pristionchus pacificus]|nr:hypothetical protein PRIPAC_89069 [Pristionchus pacificus]
MASPPTESFRRVKDLPTYDDEIGLLPEAPASERAHDRHTVWVDEREEVIKRLFAIADELDSLKRGCDVSTVVGSTVGIGAGATVIGGLLIAPPVAIAGIVVGSLAAAANITTSLVKVGFIRKRAKEVLILVKEDEKLHDIFLVHLKELLKERISDDADETGEEAIEILQEEEVSKNQLEPGIQIATSVGAAMATGVSAAGARAALLETSRLAPVVAKGLAHGAAGIGIVIDTLTLVLSSRDLLKGASLEYAVKLREVAKQLKQEMHAETAQFLKAILAEEH